MAGELLAPTLNFFGFHAAAASVPHWRHDATTHRAWDEYAKSQGNVFLDMQGKPFTAPKVMTKKREYKDAT
jgi:hypothetical protein